MSQKTNTITLRNNKYFLNSYKDASSLFTTKHLFFIKLKQLLKLKNVIISNNFLNFSGKKVFFFFNVFFNTLRVKKYAKRRKILDASKFFNLYSKENMLNITINSFFKKFNYNLITYKILVVNHFLNKKLLKFLFKSFKKYLFNVFNKKITFFLDFLKTMALYSYSFMDLDAVSSMLAQIFRFLQKKTHSKFIFFCKNLINVLINDLENKFNIKKYVGIKLILKGRLKGKPIASSLCIQKGLIPIQSIDKNVSYSKSHIFTKKYGVFGLKLWILNN